MALSSKRFSITSLLVHWEGQIDSIPLSCLVLKTNYIHQKQPFTINMFRGLTLFPLFADLDLFPRDVVSSLTLFL